jgi:membrane protease YdiL (CAAX protease family)
MDPFAVVREEAAWIGAGPAPRVSVGVAAGVTAAAVAWGNGVVLVQRTLGGDAGEWFTAAANPLLGAAGCTALFAAGWRREDLGLRWPSWRASGRRWLPGVAVGALVAGAAGVLALTGGTDAAGADARVSLVRMAVGTALGEELVHRGFLFGLWSATGRSPWIAIAANGVAFGAWHLAAVQPYGRAGRLVGVLGPATAGTAAFLWARCRSRSVLGSAPLHLATNITGSLVRPRLAPGR